MIPRSVQEVRFTDTGTSGTQTITAVNVANTAVFVTYSVAEDFGFTYISADDYLIEVDLQNSTTLRWSKTADVFSWSTQITAYVVEFDSNTTIQAGNFVLADDAVSGTESLTAYTPGNTFMVMTHTAGDNFGPELLTKAELATGSPWQITFTRNTGLGAFEQSYRYYVIESADLTVQQISTTMLGTRSEDIPITAVTLAESFVVGYNSTTGSLLRDALTSRITSTTNVKVNKGSAGIDCDWNGWVVESTNFDTEAFRIDGTGAATSGSTTIATVDRTLTIIISSNIHQYVEDSAVNIRVQDVLFEAWLSADTTLNWRRGGNDTTGRLQLYVVQMPQSVVYEQEGYRWRDDDGSESAATWREAQDTTTTVNIGETVRLRVLSANTGNVTPPSATATLQWRRQGDADSFWEDVD